MSGAAIACKVLTSAQMAQFIRDGTFTGAPVDLADGYVHLSTPAQLTETVDKHFRGQDHLFVLAVDLARLGSAVRWEPSRGGKLFPHLYAPLPQAAIIASGPLTRAADGTVQVPIANP